MVVQKYGQAKLLVLPADDLIRLMTGVCDGHIAEMVGLPDDVEVMGVWSDIARGGIIMRLCSEEWDTVDAGAEAPMLSLDILLKDNRIARIVVHPGPAIPPTYRPINSAWEWPAVKPAEPRLAVWQELLLAHNMTIGLIPKIGKDVYTFQIQASDAFYLAYSLRQLATSVEEAVRVERKDD